MRRRNIELSPNEYVNDLKEFVYFGFHFAVVCKIS